MSTSQKRALSVILVIVLALLAISLVFQFSVAAGDDGTVVGVTH